MCEQNYSIWCEIPSSLCMWGDYRPPRTRGLIVGSLRDAKFELSLLDNGQDNAMLCGIPKYP